MRLAGNLKARDERECWNLSFSRKATDLNSIAFECELIRSVILGSNKSRILLKR